MDHIFVERSKGSPSLLPPLCSPPVAVPSIGYRITQLIVYERHFNTIVWERFVGKKMSWSILGTPRFIHLPEALLLIETCWFDLQWNEMNRIFSNRIKKIQINRSIDSKSKLKKLLYLKNQDTNERFISKIYTVSFFIIENDSAQTVGRLIEDKMHTCITFNKICFGGRIRC